MKFELNMSSEQHLTEAIAGLKTQGVDARIGRCGFVYRHVLVVEGMEAAQEGLVRGWVLQLDPHAERVLPPA